MTPEHWLNIATHGLAPQSGERVRTEYLAHLEDALEAGESVMAVLTEWGDPHRANAELKKAHLTTREARYLPAGYAPTPTGLGKAFQEDALILGLWSAALIRDLLSNDFSPAGLGLLGVAGLVISLRWFFLSRGHYSQRVRAFIWWLLTPLHLIGLSFLGFLGWYFTQHGLQVWDELPRGWWAYTLLLGIAGYYTSRLLTALSAARKAEARAGIS